MKIKTLATLFIFILSTLLQASDFDSKESEYKYEGMSGQKYKYDLSDPVDKLEYKLDLDAQMNDKLLAPINPAVGLDRGIGQYGGGILDD